MATGATIEAAGLDLILGSSSRWRKIVLERSDLGPFKVLTADIDEKAITAGFSDRNTADPEKLTLAIASAKAEAILPKVTSPTILVTSDQIVVYEGKVREKPESAEECYRYLKSYETKPAETCTAVVVINTKNNKRTSGIDRAKQHFSPIPEPIATELIAKGDVMHCCGGFMIDDPILHPYLTHREGTEDSIMGLPIALLKDLISSVL